MAEQSMMERVAFAMFCADTPIAEKFHLEVWEGRCMPGPNQWGLPDKDEDLAGSVAGVHQEHGRDFYRSLAKAAIKAMREPTKTMQIVGFEALGPDRDCPCDQYDCYRAMIDAALQDSGERTE